MLTTFTFINQHTAQGANLIFFIPTCIVAIIVNIKNKNIKFNVAIPVISAGIMGAIIGAIISVNMPIKMLKKFFGIFLLIIAIYEMYSLINVNIFHKKSNNKK